VRRRDRIALRAIRATRASIVKQPAADKARTIAPVVSGAGAPSPPGLRVRGSRASLFHSGREARGDGAPRGARIVRACGAGASCAEDARAPWRSVAAFLSPAPCFPARNGRLLAFLIRAASAALRSRHVQPFRAAGLSAGGRLARASRARGYEPRSRAPHPAPSARRLRKTPSDEQGEGGVGGKCGGNMENIPMTRALAGRPALTRSAPLRVLSDPSFGPRWARRAHQFCVG
jgi:hypothetical protein